MGLKMPEWMETPKQDNRTDEEKADQLV